MGELQFKELKKQEKNWINVSLDCKRLFDEKIAIQEKLNEESRMCNKYKSKIEMLENKFMERDKDCDKYVNVMKKFQLQGNKEEVEFIMEQHSRIENLLQIITSERDALKSRNNSL